MTAPGRDRAARVPVSGLAAALRHDHAVATAGLVVVIAFAWLYLLFGAGIDMDVMDMGGGGRMIMATEWTPAYAALLFVMWAVMMAAMMLPGAAPAILLVDRIGRQRAAAGAALNPALFALGYLAVWTAFSLAATALQWGLDRRGLLSPEMAAASRGFAGAVLVAAGLYQWTPMKQACLVRCRSPLDFLLRHWHEGPAGLFATGLRHGVSCLGCCWLLMALLFIGGLMNVLWIAGLALLVLLEKTLPWGGRMSRWVGAALIAWGAAVLWSQIGSYPASSSG